MAKTWADNTFKKLRPITKGQVNFARKNGAKFIFVNDKEGNATCQYCESNMVLPKSKHLGKVQCPVCKKELVVQHTWRMKKYLRTISWTVVPKVIDDTLVLRFLLATSYGDSLLHIEERARMCINENKAEAEYWCLKGKYDYTTKKHTDEWAKGKQPYFSTPSYMCPNAYFCLEATEYPRNFFKEINKLDCFKYYPVEKVYSFNSYSSQLHYLVRSARLNEKLFKLGMADIDREHRTYYWSNGDRCLKVNNSKTTVHEMLGISKEVFKELRKGLTFSNLKLAMANKNLDIATLRYAIENKISDYDIKAYVSLSAKVGVTVAKMHKYIKTQKCSRYEFSWYLDKLSELDYDLHDMSYVLPKDFHKEYDRVSKEYNSKQNTLKAEFEAKKNELLKAIQQKVYEIPELKEFFSGKNGYMVSCPATVEEFVNEGKAQHNCVGSDYMDYTGKVAKGQTLIFFIRRLAEPNASFITMEYRDGRIIQCMYDHNRPVEHNAEVYQFAEAFTKRLSATNIKTSKVA